VIVNVLGLLIVVNLPPKASHLLLEMTRLQLFRKIAMAMVPLLKIVVMELAVETKSSFT
jgi:hypothetical protein